MLSLDIHVPRLEYHSHLWVGRGLIERLSTIINFDSHSRVLVVVDKGAKAIIARLPKTTPFSILEIEGGESLKSVDGLSLLWRSFSEHSLDRKSLILSVGGGATSDLVGFAAATFMRGIRCANIPTTLLAQVDASVGGKTGINFGGVKNLVGAIAQPSAIIVDIDALSSLPEREVRSGFAEIIKHGLIADTSYFEHVSARAYNSWSADEMVNIVHRSCEIKKKVVEADETEQGLRKTLNFGHSIGHALESYFLSSNAPLTHGEAIAIGMVGEALISQRLGKISEAELLAIEAGLSRVGLPTRLPTHVPIESLRALIAKDKKNVGGHIKWSLLERIGQAAFDVVVPDDRITEALTTIQPEKKTV